MSNPAPRLGRGLGALIGSAAAQAAIAPLHAGAAHANQVPIDKIVPNRLQPRATFVEESLGELAESIRTTGVLQPILVRGGPDGQFELIAGERRWRAAKLAGLTEIPAVIRSASDREALQLALIENLQREDLGPLERAAAYQKYIDAFGASADDLAAVLSESRSNVVNYLRLLRLQPEVAFMLGRGELAMGHARALAGIEDQQRQLALARLAARRNLSVRQVEALVREPESLGESTHKPTAAPDRHMLDVESALAKALGVRVKLRGGKRKNSGRIVIQYGSLDEFERIVERLGGIQLPD